MERQCLDAKDDIWLTRNANSVSLAHAPQETERQCLDAKADVTLVELGMRTGFLRIAAHAPHVSLSGCEG